MKLIHLTDTHFVPKGEKLYGRDPRVALEKAVADINENHADAELAVITGDLTHLGERESFQNLAEALEGLNLPLQLLIGNHDDRAIFAEVFPDQRRDGDGFIQSVQETSAGHFIFLDTVLAGTHAGHYCEERRDWLARSLKRASDGSDIFLFMHHPPFAVGIAGMDRIALTEVEEFRQVVEPFKGQIRHLFYGHVHRPISGSWLGIPFSTLRAMNHQVWFGLGADKPLAGSFEPPAYSVALIEQDSVVVHTHDFMDESPKFAMHDSPWDDWSRKNSQL